MFENRKENGNSITREFYFEIDDKISKDLRCGICKKIILNACIAPCGCRSCLECMIKYLNGNEKFCPNKLEACKITKININTNIHIDQEINRKIASLTVKCPFETCPFTDELKWIEEHMRVCNFRPMHCPYLTLGCRNPEVINDTMKTHLFNENYSHSKLLIEWIDNLRNEIESLRMKIIEFKSQIETLILDKIENRTRIVELETEKANASAEIETLKLAVNVAKEDSESKFDALEEENEKNQTEIMKQMNILTANVTKLQSNLETQNHGEFLWTIENFSDKRKHALDRVNPEIYSEPFYSHKNGYKMCLRVNPNGINSNGEIHFAVAVCIMQGPFDDILSWPFTNDIILALINQRSGLIHSNCRLRFDDFPNHWAWVKPTGQMNRAIGPRHFVRLVEVLACEGLCCNDRIFLKCTVQNRNSSVNRPGSVLVTPNQF